MNPRLTMNETIPYLPGLSPVEGKDGAPLQQEYGVLVVPAKVSVAEWVEQARNLRADQK
jgi:hypothetical protein